MNLKTKQMTARSLLWICLLAAVPVQAATVNGSVEFLGGIAGTWRINFTSSDSRVELKKVEIQLPATYGFDTAGGGFGLLTSQDFLKVSGGATAVGLNPATAAARDGANYLAIDFTGFTQAAGAYLFLLDVDGTAPAPEICASGISGIGCRARNGAATLAASTVTGEELAGTQFNLTFGFPALDNTTLQLVLPSGGALISQAETSGVVTPEPATYGLMGVALVGLSFLRRRRQ